MKHGKNGGATTRVYKVKGLTQTAADDSYFDVDEGSKMSVAQYFTQSYGIKCALC